MINKQMVWLAVLGGVLGLIGMASANGMSVSIHTAFPGGNALVINNVDDTVALEPDLRGGGRWFYWCIEATASQAGTVTFDFSSVGPSSSTFPVGLQGPAMSDDGGNTWSWMGTETVDVTALTFTHTFTEDHLTMRFASTIPYLQHDLDLFLSAHAGNAHLSVDVLTQSRGGRDVKLLQIGEPGPEKRAILFTARHHACETMASYVLEGFVAAAIGGSMEAVTFRNNHVLYVVPFVDRDGVEAGDQGKNRYPHDHNRDYGYNSLYPEIDAIESLAVTKNIRYLVDWHCPTLRMDIHQAFYFVGPLSLPVFNDANVSAFAANMKSELPASAPGGPNNLLSDGGAATMCSEYFGVHPGSIMSASLEVPFSPPGKAMDPASCRTQGAAILRAWTQTAFQQSDEYTLVVSGGSGDGFYGSGIAVAIEADVAPAGQVFDAWTGDTATVVNRYDPTTMLIMPSASITLTATYKEPGMLYALAVTGGSGSGSYSENTVVDLVAAPPVAGQEFVAWAGDTVWIDDVHAASTSVTMPPQAVALTATYQPVTMLLAHWKMDETDGGYADDATGHGYKLIPGGGMTIAGATRPGKIGHALAFDGDRNTLTHPFLLDTMPEGITIAGWLKPDATGKTAAMTWLSKQNANTVPGPAQQLWLRCSVNSDSTPGTFSISYRIDGVFQTLNSGVTWENDTWYHYALTWDASGLCIYINGALKNSNTTAGPIGDNAGTSSLIVGESSYQGLIDDVRIYSRILGATEVAALYDMSQVMVYPLTVNNGSGSANYSEGTVVSITADDPPAGEAFTGWEGDVEYLADVASASTTVTMPAEAVTVTAAYSPLTITNYTLTVNYGSGSGSYETGTGVSITANEPSVGEAFAGWEGDVEYLVDASAVSTTLTMPAQAVTLTATYQLVELIKTWNGAGDDNNWSTAANWDGAAPVDNADSLIFSGTRRLVNTNDLPADWYFGGITFTADAGPFVLNGNAIQAKDNPMAFANQSAQSQTINVDLNMGSNWSTWEIDRGTVTVNGDITSNASSGQWKVNQLSTLTKSGFGTLVLAGSNTFSNTGTYGPGLKLLGGTVVLDMDAGGSITGTKPTRIDYGVGISHSGELNHGGTFVLRGKQSGTSSQVMGRPRVYPKTEGLCRMIVDPNGGDRTTLTLEDVWEIHVSKPRPVLQLDVSRSGAKILSSPELRDDGLIKSDKGDWIVVTDTEKTGYATVRDGEIVRYEPTALLCDDSNTSLNLNTNYYIAGDVTLTASTHYCKTITIRGGGTCKASALRTSSILMEAGVSDYTIEAGSWLGSTSGDLIFHQYSLAGALIINTWLNEKTITKSGPGSVNIVKDSKTVEDVVIIDGRLNLDATLTADPVSVRVSSGGTLGGSGMLGVSGTTTLRLYPGGTLDATYTDADALAVDGTLVLEEQSILSATLALSAFSSLIVTGSVTNENANLVLTLAAAPKAGDTFTLLTSETQIEGSFATINGEVFGRDGTFTLYYEDKNYRFGLVSDETSVAARCLGAGTIDTLVILR